MRSLTTVAIMAITINFGFAVAQSLPQCASNCLSNMVLKFNDFGCQSPDDLKCLCAKPAWHDGITSCGAGACQGADVGFAALLVDTVKKKCADALASGTPQPPPPPPPVNPTPQPSIAPPTPSTSANPPPATPTPSTSRSVTPPTSPTSAAGGSTTSKSSAPTPLMTSSTTGSSSSDAASPTSETASPTVQSGAKQSTGGNKGLSRGTIIGLAVGLGTAFCLLAALLIALCARCRHRGDAAKDAEKPSISKPILQTNNRGISTPSTRHAAPIASTNHHTTNLGGGFKTTRYEELVPRTQPSKMQS